MTEKLVNRDDNGWKQLRQYIDERRDLHRDRKAQMDTRRKHELEQRIAELQRRPVNGERDGLINRLREELEIVGVCIDYSGEIATVCELESRLAAIEARAYVGWTAVACPISDFVLWRPNCVRISRTFLVRLY